MRAYDSAYERERKGMLARDPVCWRCGREATTADHVPPLALHAHVAGSGCCVLEPACARCNYRDGGRIGGKRRAARRRAVRAAMVEASRPW